MKMFKFKKIIKTMLSKINLNNNNNLNNNKNNNKKKDNKKKNSNQKKKKRKNKSQLNSNSNNSKNQLPVSYVCKKSLNKINLSLLKNAVTIFVEYAIKIACNK